MKHPVILYRPFQERTPDSQYRDLLHTIMQRGKEKVPIHARLPENAHLGSITSKDITGYQFRHDLSNGFPLQTIRGFEQGFYGSLAELRAFLGGAQTLEELRAAGVPDIFWAPSLTKEKCSVFGLEEGDMGPGSYGSVLRRMSGPGGTAFGFDQILALENKIRNAPDVRTIALTTWDPRHALGDKTQDFPRKVVVAPCHGTFTLFKIYPDEKELHVHSTQRSADAPVGLMGNITQWCALGMMVADLFGYTFTEYVYSLADAQIYSMQYPAVEQLIEREPRKLPTVLLEPKEKRNHLWEYRPEDFILSDYDPHPKMKVPVAV